MCETTVNSDLGAEDIASIPEVGVTKSTAGVNFCENCGYPISDGTAAFCGNCGKQILRDKNIPAPNNMNTLEPVQQIQPAHEEPSQRKLKSDRNSALCILLSFCTFGIYYIVLMTSISKEINTIASPHDGKKTMHYCLAILLSVITAFVYYLLWFVQLSDRISKEIKRRNISFKFNSADLLVYGILLAPFTCGITSLIYYDRLINAMNALSADYNEKGC